MFVKRLRLWLSKIDFKRWTIFLMMYNYEVKTFFDLKSNLFFSLQETDQIFQMPYSGEGRQQKALTDRQNRLSFWTSSFKKSPCSKELPTRANVRQSAKDKAKFMSLLLLLQFNESKEIVHLRLVLHAAECFYSWSINKIKVLAKK